jgi:hypothetical protein
MIPASQRLYGAIVDGRLVHPDDPQLDAHAATAVARHGRRGWRIDKSERGARIDTVVALAMAVDRAASRPVAARLVGWARESKDFVCPQSEVQRGRARLSVLRRPRASSPSRPSAITAVTATSNATTADAISSSMKTKAPAQQGMARRCESPREHRPSPTSPTRRISHESRTSERPAQPANHRGKRNLAFPAGFSMGAAGIEPATSRV